MSQLREPATPNHALQRTAPRVTLAASGLRLAPTMQPARRAEQFAELGGVRRCSRLVTMKQFIAALIAAVTLVPSFAGEVYDLGERRTVPDWAVGPLLVVPVERVRDRRLNVPRSETRRIGTLQASYIELSGQRHRFASIRLSEVPNDGYSCSIKTAPDSGRYFDIHVSQSLYDQTFYYFYVRTMQVGSDEPIEKQNYAVWDAKSRK